MPETSSERTAIAEVLAYDIWHYDRPNKEVVVAALSYVDQVLEAMRRIQGRSRD